MFGAIAGIVLGLLLCFLQQRFGLISLGGGNGSFVVDAYPVSVHATDIILVFVTVITVGFLSVWYPVRYLSKRLLKIKHPPPSPAESHEQYDAKEL